jgi:hypothetical protein
MSAMRRALGPKGSRNNKYTVQGVIVTIIA